MNSIETSTRPEFQRRFADDARSPLPMDVVGEEECAGPQERAEIRRLPLRNRHAKRRRSSGVGVIAVVVADGECAQCAWTSERKGSRRGRRRRRDPIAGRVGKRARFLVSRPISRQCRLFAISVCLTVGDRRVSLRWPLSGRAGRCSLLLRRALRRHRDRLDTGRRVRALLGRGSVGAGWSLPALRTPQSASTE